MNPVLVEIYRGSVLESFHRGVVCIVDEHGKVIFSAGDIQQVCYPRSAMKLLQVIPLIQHGGIEKFGFTTEEIAVMCGSHNAEPAHVNAVNSILKKIGLDASALNCGPQYPSSKKDANELIRNDLKPQHIHNNCSGKHAGMLAMCVLMGWDLHDYIQPSHPLQQMILNVCGEMYGYESAKMEIALDGCSAPIFSVPVYNQALGYMNLVNPVRFDQPRQKACSIIIDAVSKHPFMVAGSKRYCTDLMNITAPGIIGKTGAEGIFCLGFTTQKLGVCIKIDDGKMLPQYNIAQALVKCSRLFPPALLQPLEHYMENRITNFNKLDTGKITVSKELMSGLEQTFSGK